MGRQWRPCAWCGDGCLGRYCSHRCGYVAAIVARPRMNARRAEIWWTPDRPPWNNPPLSTGFFAPGRIRFRNKPMGCRHIHPAPEPAP